MFRKRSSEPFRTTARVLTLATAVVVASSCGGDDQAAQLESATEELAEAQSEVEAARTTVEATLETAAVAEAELGEARQALIVSQERLANARALVGASASDAVLFRSIQRDLLEENSLDDFAIAAQVDRGVVTLAGTVASAETRERAADIARSTSGVASVNNRIEIEVSAAKE